MKTILDIETMKEQPTNVFGNAYNYLIESLANDYISKLTGKERIQSELNKWDLESRSIILNDIKSSVESTGIDFIWE